MVGALPVASVHGRDDELRALDAVLDRVVSGRSTVLLLEGEAGIGKSRLLGETLTRARARDLQVVAGRGEDLERTRPFGVLAEALGCRESSDDIRLAYVASLLSSHATADGAAMTVTSDPGLRFRVVDAFVDVVEAQAIQGPLVIGIDDLQWADSSTAVTIGAIGRRLAHLPVAIVGCLRPAPRTAQLERLLTTLVAAGAERLVLGPLDEEAVGTLVTEMIDASPAPGLLREIGGAGGNPFFVTELLAAIREEGSLQTSDGRADVTHVTLPPTLRLTILRRLGFLSEDAMHALRAASILGSSFVLTDLSVTTNRSVVSLSEDLHEAIVARVLADEGDRLRFRHDLIRDAIYGDIPASVRLALHRESGHRLADHGAPVRQVAEQLDRGALRGDAEAVSWLTAAAREAAPGSPDIAIELFDRVVDLMDPADPERDTMLAARVGGLMSAGRVAECEEASRDLLARTHHPAAAGAARASLGLALLTSGRPGEGLEELEQAAVSDALTDVARTNALGWSSVARLWLGDLDGTDEAARVARQAATSCGDDLTSTIARSMDAVVSLVRGRLARAERAIDDALSFAGASPGRRGLYYPAYAPAAFVLMELDRFDEARFALDTGSRLSDELGAGWHQPSYLMAYATERFLTGEWDDAGCEVDTSNDVAAETGEGYHLIITRGVLALMQLHRNDVGAAEATAALAVDQLTSTGSRYRAQWAMLASALAREARGDQPGALAVLAEAWDACARLGLEIESRVIGPDLVRLALACGDRARADQAVAGVAALAAANDVPSLHGAALRCRGLVDDDLEILQAAADAYADGPRVLERAATHEDLGAACLRHGELDRGRGLLEGALDTYAARGMLRDVARAEAVLRRAGIRRGRRVSRGRPTFGWESLTPTEETVARLVAEGLSNPQIGDRLYVSRRTVQTHLGHVFTKLGISSRSHLAAEVTRRGATTGARS